MIRPFGWRDLALLHRVRNVGLCLDSHLACTQGHQALQNALLGALAPRRSTYTLVAFPTHPTEMSAVGQIRQLSDQPYARLTFIGPMGAFIEPICVQLLDALSQSAGEGGAHHLIAEADEFSPVFERLREAGFAIYARQRIWRIADTHPGNTMPMRASWRVERSSDINAIQNLYHNLVPALVQQVEPPPVRNTRGLVHWDEGELLGYLDVDRGSQGTWVQPYFHPAAERIGDLLASFLKQYAQYKRRPLHVCVRSYQGGLNEALGRLGFEACHDQAVMVKRLAALVRHRIRAALPALDGTQPEPTAPFSSMENHISATRRT